MISTDYDIELALSRLFRMGYSCDDAKAAAQRYAHCTTERNDIAIRDYLNKCASLALSGQKLPHEVSA